MKKILLLALLLANSNILQSVENNYIQQAKQYAHQAGEHLKSATSQSINICKFITEKSDKILNKKTAIAILLAVGPGFYLSSRIFGLNIMQTLIKNISKITIKGGVLAGEPVVNGAAEGIVEALKESPQLLYNLTTSLAQVTATTSVQATKAALWAGLQAVWYDKLQFLTLLAIYGSGLAAVGTAGMIGAATIEATAKGVGPQLAVKIIIPIMAKFLPFLTIPLLSDIKI